MCESSDVNGKEATASATLSLKVMINKERNKVVFAEADNQVADILLSFLTLPLGRIIKVLEKKYGDEESPSIGSLSSLYHSLADLHTSHFVTEAAKLALLNPASSFDDHYQKLKLDISDSPPAQYFFCDFVKESHNRFRSVSTYYDKAYCKTCRIYSRYRTSGYEMRKELGEKGSKAASDTDDGVVLTMRKASFTISDDLQIFPNEMGLLRIIDILGITDAHKAEIIHVAFGFNQIMELLKASLTSPTPLSDVILNKTRKINYSSMVKSQPKIVKEEDSNPRNLSLKLMMQKSSGKLLYAQAEEEFVQFLFSLFHLPLGAAEMLMGGKACIKPIDNLYRSLTDLIDLKFFKTAYAKERLTKPKLPHGCISKDYILPLTEECLPADYTDNLEVFSSVNFPKGQGIYLDAPVSFKVTDDLMVTPFCTVSIVSSLNDMKIPLSDVKEVVLQIGTKEALSILRASFTSNTALTDGLLLNHMPNK